MASLCAGALALAGTAEASGEWTWTPSLAIGAGVDLSRAPHRLGPELQLVAGVDVWTRGWLLGHSLALTADGSYLPLAAGGSRFEPRLGLLLEHVAGVTPGPEVSFSVGAGGSIGIGARSSLGATVFVGASTFHGVVALELSARAFSDPLVTLTLQLNVGRGLTRLIAVMAQG